MNRSYDSITILKGFACVIVFTAHWLAFFGSFGSPRIDRLVNEGPLYIFLYSSMCVSIFLMLSACLAALKIYRTGKTERPAAGIFRRYLSLCIPMFFTSLLVFVFQKMGLLFTGEAGEVLNNDFLRGMYAEPLKGADLILIPFVRALFREENAFYVPFWMMCYIFLGCLISMGLAVEILDIRRPVCRAAVFAALFAAMSVLDSYYLCAVLGNLLAYMIAAAEKYQEKTAVSVCPGGTGKKRLMIAAAAGFALFLAGIRLSHTAYFFAWGLEHTYGLEKPLSDSWYWQVLCGFMIICGFMTFYETIVLLTENKEESRSEKNSSEHGAVISRLLCALGGISYEVFLTHWLVFCSFSCCFYLKFADRHMHVSILLNLIVSFLLTMTASAVYKLGMDRILNALRRRLG